MNIFKRVALIERQLDNEIEENDARFSNIASSITKLGKRIEQLEKENKELREKLPDYEDAISKGVERRWDDAVQAITDFNPYVGLNKPEVNK